MNRRLFLTNVCKGVALLGASSVVPACGEEQSTVRFGVISDLHYAGCETRGTRYYAQTIDKLREAIKVFNTANLDFIIELGDLKDQDAVPQPEKTIFYLKEIEKELHSFNRPVYHVLGNHDMDSISKEEFLQHTSNYGTADKKAYYSFSCKGIKFIVLDANYNLDGSPYNKGNFDWTKAIVPDEQLKWLKEELKESKQPIIVFTHQLLDNFSDIDSSVCVTNAGEIRQLLEENGNVKAVFQGHHHAGHYSCRNNIHYWTIKGLIEGEWPSNNSFATVEIEKQDTIRITGYYNCEDKDLKW